MGIRKNFLALLFISSFINLNAQDRITGRNFASRSEVIGRNGMVASSHPLATQVGLDILKKGGTAVDAAIAVNATLGLMEPTGCGIGGDLFAMVWSAKDQKIYGLNASGRAPKKMSTALFKRKKINKVPEFGPLSVTVPGCVDGWFELHKKFGSLNMSTILDPAIQYAREGFPVTEVIAHYLKLSASRYYPYPNFKQTYMPDGKIPAKGDWFKNPYLANTYETIAKEGRDVFYKGALAKKMAVFLRSKGGLLDIKDLSSHQSEWVEPIKTNYRGYDVWELPPNGQGLAALQILNIMEGLNPKKMGFGSSEYIHHLTEAKKIAFEDRAKYYADPKFSSVPVDSLLSKAYANQRRKLIREFAAKRYTPGKLEQGDTVYLTVADSEGNMVSLIQSNYMGMGSGMVAPQMGFMFQNRGALFNLDPTHQNVLKPGKRPFHTIIPAMITKNNKPWVSFGLMGGAMQPQGHAQIVMNLVDFEMNIQEAGDAPRIRHIGSSQPTGEKMFNGGELYLESGFDYQTIRDLIEKGHRIKHGIGVFGGYQAIMYDEQKKVYYGASESRKDGQAAAY